MILNIILPLLLFIILIIPIVLQYILNWNLTIISVYGIYLFIYLSIQFVFAIINNKGGDKYKNTILKDDMLCNIMVVGREENIDYYKMCLESIKTVIMDSMNVTTINRVYIIIDGNAESDEYMVDVAKKTFENYYEYISVDSNINFTNVLEKALQKQIIIISQPHIGKRNAMHIGFKLSILEKKFCNQNLETIFCTDSDTVITSDSINESINRFKNPNVSAVTGNLSIYNKYTSFVAFMSKIRYWFAFNLERAYQSYNECVLCVSGPLGMYRLSTVETILDKWINQIFLGKKCTYGDDRHLTNLILSTNKKILYSCKAYAETETPESIYRFYKQQVRWSKSSFREFFWTSMNVNKQSAFMTVDLIYTFMYPYIVMGYMMYLLWSGTLFELGIYLNTILVLGIIKSLYGAIVSGIYENLFYVFYSIIYICIVFPAKLWGLININDNSWGTSFRKTNSNDISADIIMLILWNLNLLSGFVYTLWRNINIKPVSMVEWILLGIPLSVFIVGTIITYIYINFRKNVFNKKKE